MCKAGDILSADRGEEELPTNLSALVYSLLQEYALVQAKDLKLSIKEHHSRHGHWPVQVTSLLPSPMWIFLVLFNLLLTLSKSASITGPGHSPLTDS